MLLKALRNSLEQIVEFSGNSAVFNLAICSYCLHQAVALTKDRTMTHPTSMAPQSWSCRQMPGIYMEPDLLDSDAFADLTGSEFRVLLRFYRKRQIPKKRKSKKLCVDEIVNNGKIIFTYTEAAEMGIPKTSFTRSLDGLLARGFIDITHTGQGLYRSASTYAISDRWKHYGTDKFVNSARPKRSRKVGFTRDMASLENGTTGGRCANVENAPTGPTSGRLESGFSTTNGRYQAPQVVVAEKSTTPCARCEAQSEPERLHHGQLAMMGAT